MKKAKKALLLALCAVLLVGATIAGTVAYLTSNPEPVVNTFTVGNVTITLDETDVDLYGVKDGETPVKANQYKLIPGHTYLKDPTVHVAADSEDCHIFVKIENGLAGAATLNMSSEWHKIFEDGNTSIWVYGTAAAAAVVTKNSNVTPFDKFTFDTDANPSTYADANITVTAYAIQADTLNGKPPAEIWALFSQN